MLQKMLVQIYFRWIFIFFIIVLPNISWGQPDGFYFCKKRNTYFYFQGNDTILIMSEFSNSMVTAKYVIVENKLILDFSDYNLSVVSQNDECNGIYLKLNKPAKIILNGDTLEIVRNQVAFYTLTWTQKIMPVLVDGKLLEVSLPTIAGCYMMDLVLDESLFMTLDREKIKIIEIKNDSVLLVNGDKFKRVKKK